MQTLIPPPRPFVSAYVVFNPARKHERQPWWWTTWLRIKGDTPSHVSVMFWSGDRWIAFEAGLFRFDWGEAGFDPDHPRRLAVRGARVFHVERRTEDRFYWRGLISCVSVAKMALGIRAPRVVTPNQLMRWLIDEGHEEVVADGIGTKAQALTGRHSGRARARKSHRYESGDARK